MDAQELHDELTAEAQAEVDRADPRDEAYDAAGTETGPAVTPAPACPNQGQLTST